VPGVSLQAFNKNVGFEMRYFAFNDMEDVVDLGDHDCFCDADSAASGNTVWIIDRESLVGFVKKCQDALNSACEDKRPECALQIQA
jgi:hypothetical protein